MSLDNFVRHFLEDPNNDETSKENVRSLKNSHLVTGKNLQQQGLLNEAISEFAKEHNRPIHSDIDKEILQNSYWHVGKVYRQLGDLEKAKAAFQKAYEYWNLYDVGTPPQYNLAEILLEQEQFDEAIEMCQELLKLMPDGGAKQLLDKILALKKGK